MISSNLSFGFWADAARYAVYTLIRVDAIA
jgi:hypothetical protein